MPLGPTTVVDGFRSFPQGMNAGVDPVDLPKSQLAMLVNGTVRGGFVSNRPVFQLLSGTGDYDGSGLFQGCCYFKPDYGSEMLVAQIGGNWYTFVPGNQAVVSKKVVIPGPALPADATNGPFMVWMWQGEKWVFGQDGQSLPIFFDGVNAVRSGLSNQIATIGAVTSLTVGATVAATIAAYPGGGSYAGPFNVPVNIVNAGTTKSLGEFEIVQTTSVGGTNAYLTLQGSGSVSFGVGDSIFTRTYLNAWTATVTAAVIADTTTGTWRATSPNAQIGAHCNFPLSTTYTGSVGDIVHFSATAGLGTIAVDIAVEAVSNNGNTIELNLSSYPGYNCTNIVITRTYTIPKPNMVSVPLSSPWQSWQGGSTIYLYISSQWQAFAVLSQSGLSVTIDVSGFTGTISSGTNATNTTNAGFTANLVGTVQTAVTVTAAATHVTLSPVPPVGINETVYDNSGHAFTLTCSQGSSVTTINLLVVSLNGTANSIGANAMVYLSNQMPIGRMGSYIMGRNYLCLPDGISWLCSDATGEDSGSAANNYRDAIEFCNDVNRLTSGTFRVPGGTSGSIVFIMPMNTLDVSLGQGPAQVGTEGGIFSANLDSNATNWQTQTSPVLTQSMIGGGGVSQRSAVNVNDDLIYRAVDGQIRSLKLSRQDFSTWGQVPCSKEVQLILSGDTKSLLPYSTAATFDNRVLMTTGLKQGAQGFYGTKTVVINLDPVSSMAGKSASVWDGVWEGVNVLQYVTGKFGGVERCFAFCYDPILSLIQLYEVLPSTPKPQSGPVSDSYQINDWTATDYRTTVILEGRAQAVSIGDTIQAPSSTATDQWLGIVTSPSQLVPIATTQALAAPTLLSATGENTQIVLAWTSVAGATGYKIWRWDSTVPGFVVIYQTTDTAYTDTGLTNDLAQTYYITAINATQESAPSNSLSAIPSITQPTAPVIYSISPGNAQVVLAWVEVTGATSYHVKRATVVGGPYTTIGTTTAIGYTDTGVTNGTTYYYVVSAVSVGGESSNSNEVSATPSASTIPAPTLSLDEVLSGEVDLIWTAVAGAVTYHTFYSTVRGGPYALCAITLNTRSFVSGLTNGTTYYFVVSAGNSSNVWSGYSNEVSATPRAGSRSLTTFTMTLLTASALPYSPGRTVLIYLANGTLINNIQISSISTNTKNQVVLACINNSGSAFTLTPNSILAGYSVTWQDAATIQSSGSISITGVRFTLADVWPTGDSIVMLSAGPALLTGRQYSAVFGLSPIKTRFETGPMLRDASPASANGTSKRGDQLAMLSAGEIYLKDLQDDLDIAVYFRPDYSWAWRLWRAWTLPFKDNGASYQRVIGFGEPPKDCDQTTKRPWREGYHFHVAIEVTGHCTVMGGRVYGEVLPTPAFAPLNPVT